MTFRLHVALAFLIAAIATTMQSWDHKPDPLGGDGPAYMFVAKELQIQTFSQSGVTAFLLLLRGEMGKACSALHRLHQLF